MGVLKLFLDTTVLLSSILNRNKNSWALLNIKYPNFELITNNTSIKEMRRVLREEYNFSDEKINASVDFIEGVCKVVKTPKKEEFLIYQLRDKSDRPLICSAIKEGCDYLVTEDQRFNADAQRYIPTLRPKDVIEYRR